MTLDELRQRADAMRAENDPQALYDFGALLGHAKLDGVITEAQAKELMLRASIDERAALSH